jgi:hypothetical protein
MLRQVLHRPLLQDESLNQSTFESLKVELKAL